MGRFWAAAAAALGVVALGLAVGPAAQARADGTDVQSLVVAGTVGSDGTLSLTETFTFAAGAVPAQLVQTISTTKDTMDYRYYRYDVTGITATAGGIDLQPALSSDSGHQVITVDTAKANGEPIQIGYRVSGVAGDGGVSSNGTALTSIEWPVVQGLNIGVAQVSGTITAPGQALSVDCQSGVASGLQPCQLWAAGTQSSPNPSFSDQALPAGGLVQFSFTVPTAQVGIDQQLIDRWTLGRAFSATPVPLGVALGVLVLGAVALWFIWHMTGRDDQAKGEPTSIARFEPTGPGEVSFRVLADVRPGHIGTVVDERVDPVDVTATVLDLAVRGHLRIVELPTGARRGGLDWTFERLSGPDELADFERTLLEVIAPAGGPAATVSGIGEPVTQAIPTVQRQLYEDVAAKGWFARRPDQVRGAWHSVGWAGVAVAAVALILLIIFTHLGLLGLVLVALGLALLLIAHTMPRRTPAGVALLRGLQVLAVMLQSQPVEQIPKSRAYDEISRVLPYAVVLGGRERWLAALAADDDDPGVPDPTDLPWYHGPDDWSLADLPASIDAFVTAMQGRLYGR